MPKIRIVECSHVWSEQNIFGEIEVETKEGLLYRAELVFCEKCGELSTRVDGEKVLKDRNDYMVVEVNEKKEI